MTGNTPTPDQIQESISAAFDSVNLIDQHTLSAKTEYSLDMVSRNYQHLETMMGKNWFSSELTPQQTTDINTAIIKGVTYCS